MNVTELRELSRAVASAYDRTESMDDCIVMALKDIGLGSGHIQAEAMWYALDAYQSLNSWRKDK